MNAEDKLAEANYFLEKLRDTSNSLNMNPEDVSKLEDEFKYNLSAFIQAWRSTFDVLLYDYAEKYLKYSPERNIKITKDNFEKIADVLETRSDPEPKRFINWYKEKESILGKERLWYLRVFFVHRGGKTLETRHKDKYVLMKKPLYVPPSAISAGTVPPAVVYTLENAIRVETEKELSIAGMPETVILGECEKVYYLMDEIVTEARKSFK